MPGMMWPRGSAGGTSWLCSRSQRCANAISSRWATTMRSHRIRTDSLAPWEGAQPAIRMAWAWWPIIPARKCTSAAVKDVAAVVEGDEARGVAVAHAAAAMTTSAGLLIARPRSVCRRAGQLRHHRGERPYLRHIGRALRVTGELRRQLSQRIPALRSLELLGAGERRSHGRDLLRGQAVRARQLVQVGA